MLTMYVLNRCVYLLIKVLLALLVFLPLPKPQDAERNGTKKILNSALVRPARAQN